LPVKRGNQLSVEEVHRWWANCVRTAYAQIAEQVRASLADIGYHHLAIAKIGWNSRRRPRHTEEDGMDEDIHLSGPVDLDALDDYLMSDHAPDDSMGLSDLDGFLTGIVVGPELIRPSEWLPVIWGGKAPAFESDAEMRIVLGTIMGRYNEIAAAFNDDPIEFDPVYWEGPEGDIIASDWVGGFLDAVSLRPRAWEPMMNDQRARVMMLPLLLLNGDAAIQVGPNEKADEDAFLAEAPDVIPACIIGIHKFWQKRRESAAPGTERSRRTKGSRK
jgi:uncharacterized protein